MPLFVRILARFSGHAKVMSGPFTLGKYGFVLNVIGFVFLLFTSITFNFPTLNPVDQENMNYTSAAIGIIGLISIVTWLTTGRKHFTGPNTGIANVNMEIMGQEVNGGGFVERNEVLAKKDADVYP
jgi:choline transport protein